MTGIVIGVVIISFVIAFCTTCFFFFSSAPATKNDIEAEEVFGRVITIAIIILYIIAMFCSIEFGLRKGEQLGRAQAVSRGVGQWVTIEGKVEFQWVKPEKGENK